MKKKRAKCITIGFALAGTLSTIMSAMADQRSVNLFSWSDYVDPKVLEQFTTETGIEVVYDTYDSTDAFESRMLGEAAAHDVVVVAATSLQRQIREGVYQKLDKARLTGAKGLWPDVMARLATFDPGNQYAVNYQWFTTGIAYDSGKAKQRLGGKAVDSWDVIFRPETLRKFSDCGVYLLDSPESMFPAALRSIGANPDSKSPDDLRRAADALIRLKPSVKKFSSTEYVSALASGETCVAVGWTGDVYQARRRATEASNGVDIAYAIPREGAQISLDNLAIPRDAPHLAEAYALIDFLLRPDIAARDTATTGLANGVIASKPLVDPEIAANPSIYPKDDSLRGLYVTTGGDPSPQGPIAREWTRVLTGKYPVAKPAQLKPKLRR